MTNEQVPEQYNVPGQRRAYACTASSSDESSAVSSMVSPDPEEEVVSGGAQDSTSSDAEDQVKDDILQTDQDTIKRAGQGHQQQEQGLDMSDMDTVRRTGRIEPPARPPRVIDSIASLPSSACTDYYNLCHPPPLDPAPTIPRRKPYISHNPGTLASSIGQNPGSILSQNPGTLGGTMSSTTQSCWSEKTCEPRSRCASQSSTLTAGAGAGGRSKKKVQGRRRKGTSCHCKTSGPTAPESASKQDSVILVYSRHCSGSIEWAKYLHKLFTELSRHKGSLAVRHLPVEDITELLPARTEQEIYSSRLQLVIVSPLFLQWVYRQPGQLVGRLLQQDRVIALLLGVQEEQVTPEHRSSLVSFPQWVHLEARDHDLEFVQTVLYFSTQILQRTEPKVVATSESLSFTLFPRKVTEAQAKVVLMLDKPLNSRSTLVLRLEKPGGQRMPVEDVKLRNPYTLLATLPACLFAKSCLVSLHLEIDGESKGFRQLKCESKTHELDSLLAGLCDPLEFLCQTLAISPHCKDQLDETLTNNLMSNIPKHGFPLLSFPHAQTKPSQAKQKEQAEFPTLLHFSSGHGLEQLTCALLDCPGARQAILQKNCNNLTPSDMARDSGFFDLAEILKAHQQSPSQFSHIYDYIKHGRMEGTREDRPMSGSSQLSDYSGPDPYLRSAAQDIGAYQVPPPPRPVPTTPPRGSGPYNYLDMSRSNSGTPSGSPALQQRMMHMRSQQTPGLNTLLQQLQLRRETDTMSKYNLDSSYSQAKARAGMEDPFGTLRGSKTRRSLREKTPNMSDSFKPKEQIYVNDPFGTLRASRANSVPKSMDSVSDDVFTTVVGEVAEATSRIDYRNLNGDNGVEEDNLAVTEELLELLEDFKKKSYTVKEMEILFENWRRKAAIPENYKDIESLKTGKEDKSSKSAAYSLLKMFRSSTTTDTGNKIKKTSGTKKFLKPSSPEASEPHTPLDEDTMGLVVALPPTPLKPEPSPPQEGDTTYSSQILPLSRLSGSSLPPSTNSLQRQRPVAEVSPFTKRKMSISSSKNEEEVTPTNTTTTSSQTVVLRRQCSEELKSPVKERLQRMRRSITEPLMQYFHDMHMTSPDTEEPDVLNTPKSLLNTPLVGNNEEGDKRLSRRLFSTSSSASQRESLQRHTARTSQIHEYQNISPTPSTDL